MDKVDTKNFVHIMLDEDLGKSSKMLGGDVWLSVNFGELIIPFSLLANF